MVLEDAELQARKDLLHERLAQLADVRRRAAQLAHEVLVAGAERLGPPPELEDGGLLLRRAARLLFAAARRGLILPARVLGLLVQPCAVAGHMPQPVTPKSQPLPFQWHLHAAAPVHFPSRIL